MLTSHTARTLTGLAPYIARTRPDPRRPSLGPSTAHTGTR